MRISSRWYTFDVSVVIRDYQRVQITIKVQHFFVRVKYFCRVSNGSVILRVHKKYSNLFVHDDNHCSLSRCCFCANSIHFPSFFFDDAVQLNLRRTSYVTYIIVHLEFSYFILYTLYQRIF